MRKEEDYIEQLKEMTEKEILWFIRGNLIQDGKRLRFRMSGGDNNHLQLDKIDKGSCTLHNQKVLNTFAYLGIYDYTEHFSLDFYKGCPSLLLRFFGGSEGGQLYHEGFSEGGFYYNNQFCHAYTTSQIILEIFKLTILSDRDTRRRDLGW